MSVFPTNVDLTLEKVAALRSTLARRPQLFIGQVNLVIICFVANFSDFLFYIFLIVKSEF